MVELVVVEVDVDVDDPGGLLDLALPDPFTRKTIRMINAATIARERVRRVVRRRFLTFWMTACFWSRAARCRALFSLGTERHATEPRDPPAPTPFAPRPEQ